MLSIIRILIPIQTGKHTVFDQRFHKRPTNKMFQFCHDRFSIWANFQGKRHQLNSFHSLIISFGQCLILIFGTSMALILSNRLIINLPGNEKGSLVQKDATGTVSQTSFYLFNCTIFYFSPGESQEENFSCDECR